MPDKRLITFDDLAARWGVSVRTLRRLEGRSEIPSVRVGAQVRFDPDAIVQFEQENLREVVARHLKDLAREVGMELAGEAIAQGLTVDEARRLFDARHADEIQRARMVVGGNLRLARSVVVGRLNRETGADSLIRPRGPTRDGVLAAAERQRGPHSRRRKRPPA